MNTEVIYADGSRSEFHGNGGSSHDGWAAIERLRLLTAISALRIYIKYDGKMQLTRNGAQNAIKNVIEPWTDKTYKRSMNGKKEALADAEALLASIENAAVVWPEPTCDICGVSEYDSDLEWNGETGCHVVCEEG